MPVGLMVDTKIDTKAYLQPIMEESVEDNKLLCNFSIAEQKKTIEKLKKAHIAKPAVYIMHSHLELLTMRRYTLPWFYNAVRWCSTHLQTTEGMLPTWNYVDSTFNDDLLSILKGKDESVDYSKFAPALVIDGLYTDSSHNKIEKTRDILNLATNHTIFLILAGERPFSFCLNKLAFKPKHLISFGSQKTRSVL